MRTFLLWLHQNVIAAKGALVQALASKDELQFVEAPKIQHEYMEKIGQYEQEALEKELEAVLLEKKELLIQACINRRENVDLEKIDEMLAKEREELLKRAGLGQVQEQHRLSPEQEEKLRELYQQIVADFHPSVCPGLNKTEKALFAKATEAYQHQDLELMKLIDEMLRTDELTISFETGIEIDLDYTILMPEQKAKAMAHELAGDYTLAEEIYECFVHQQEEELLYQAAQDYLSQCSAVLEEIQAMHTRFPFSARETLDDEEKTADYLLQVKARTAQANADIARLKARIDQMIGETDHE